MYIHVHTGKKKKKSTVKIIQEEKIHHEKLHWTSPHSNVPEVLSEKVTE